MNDRVILGEEDVDLNELKEEMVYDDTSAVVSYTEPAEKRRRGAELISVEVESYGAPTKNSMRRLRDEIRNRFDINNIVMVQRVGEFEPGEKVVGILISAPERGEAFEALAMCLDLFETHIPIRKRVATVDGREYWVKRADEVMDMYGQVVGEI